MKNNIWEIGCDARYWLLAGQLAAIELSPHLRTVMAGESFGQILSSSGQADDLIAPMTGRVIEVNQHANTAMSALVRDNLAEGWLLWLPRVELITM